MFNTTVNIENCVNLRCPSTQIPSPSGLIIHLSSLICFFDSLLFNAVGVDCEQSLSVFTCFTRMCCFLCMTSAQNSTDTQTTAALTTLYIWKLKITANIFALHKLGACGGRNLAYPIDIVNLTTLLHYCRAYNSSTKQEVSEVRGGAIQSSPWNLPQTDPCCHYHFNHDKNTCTTIFPFSAPMVLVGWQEEHQVC